MSHSAPPSLTYLFFWPHMEMDGLPGWGFSSMPVPPLRQHKHKRRYKSFTHTFILTRWVWKDDDDGQMIFGDLVGLKLPDICLTGEEKPQKTSHRKLVHTGDWTRVRCMTDAHATACSTEWDTPESSILLMKSTFSRKMFTIPLHKTKSRARWLRSNARDSHSGGPGFKSCGRPTWLRFLVVSSILK